ncbi:UDP-N-acetylmuramoyl-L-alanine--D-glutamate ligase [Halomonas sp. M20]|uniref:UDP-N-acetylmuramoyl-L-alanine--D-glutamate ligase n=1 Tax=Halomonas sp. M20 TaxID=2763264 RepID=UPI001D0ABDD1|nr:UDP-N-acetylmuramoyl-L-alanine--D-glutamate ligase [Halomonas sp. M20]
MSSVPQGHTLIVGLGLSGSAVARHLTRLGTPFMVADTRQAPPGLHAFREAHPGVAIHCGPLTELDLAQAQEVVLSPGVDPLTPGLERLWKRKLGDIQESENQGAEVAASRILGEIALFVRQCRAPIAAITGSNAKSTVTTLLGEMASEAGLEVAVGGNLGTPALDLLQDHPDADLFVLELSSFQLETTPNLGATAVAFLNLSEDHLDRHGDMTRYRAAKSAIFHGASYAIVNGEDSSTWPREKESHQAPDLVWERFTTKAPQADEWGIGEYDDGTGAQPWLMHGTDPLLAVADMRLPGLHNHANALAAMALGHRLGLPLAAMQRVLKRFPGLPHRGELIGEGQGVRWINDSKGTNVGATLAAMAGLGATLTGKLIWLGGGQGKGADFSPLKTPLKRYAREAIVFGLDAPRLAGDIEGAAPITHTRNLQEALERAAAIACPGDCVLLSPACASLDQFTHYMARGDAFRSWVQEYLATRIDQEHS